jgi:single-stranded-DNA-specific exonuclease
MLKKRWKCKEIKDPLEAKLLADSLNISEALSTLLILRNIKTFQQARKFFRPALHMLHDPFLMDGMDSASLRVIEAITENQKILVYGDYDVDGTCSTALMYMFLKELGANAEYYIPNRLTEGYGISEGGIDYAKSIDTELLISVDCGITAVEETKYAKEQGIDIIICDHHQPKDVIPPAYAVLDPLKPGDQYPFKYLSGAGVAFKLAQGICERIGKSQLPLKYLDLVALAGAADIVPLNDENRILVKLGLDLVNLNPRPGLSALMNSARIDEGQLSAQKIVFSIAPRINAVGRLSDAGVAVELMVTEDVEEAAELATRLEKENSQRKKIDEDTLNDALDKVEQFINLDSDLAIVLHEEDWHPGVIGIVASRLVEKFYRPTIMLTTIDGVAKGSARSIANFNIYEALNENKDLLMHFGGHQAAAGLSIEIDKIPELRKKINAAVKDKVSEADLQPLIEIDAKLRLSEITPKFIRILNQFAPFGPENPKPIFLAEDVVICSGPRIVGNNHLLFTVKQNGCDRVFDAIGFSMGHWLEELQQCSSFDIIYTIDQTSRDGRTFPQFRLKDIKIKNK